MSLTVYRNAADQWVASQEGREHLVRFISVDSPTTFRTLGILATGVLCLDITASGQIDQARRLDGTPVETFTIPASHGLHRDISLLHVP